MNNRITQLFGIEKPIVQAGMVWVSGWRLASAVSNAGGLGIIGAGSMYPSVLEEHIIKCKANTNKPFGVNLPLLYPDIQHHIATIIKQKIPIVFTSAGNPKLYTKILQQEGITVVHVVSSSVFAKKAEDAGVDAVVAEGFEAGGHNGREETTTFVLVPMVKETVQIPVIAAGGIATGKQMLAVFVLGAEGVQIGSRFVCSEEASAHPNFKAAILDAKEGDTLLSMKKTVPVRLLKNMFFNEVMAAEKSGATAEQLIQLLGKGRAKKGMFLGDVIYGELEIGQVSSLLKQIQPAKDIVDEIWATFLASVANPLTL